MDRRNRVGDLMISHMRQEGVFSACTHDGIVSDVGNGAGLRLWKGMNPHPLSYARVAMSYLRRDERFDKGLIRACDIRGRETRLQSVFLKEEYQ